MQDFRAITGGKWWKVDFHLHTPGSYDYGRGNEIQKKTTPEDFLRCCMMEKLDCIVIADHNTFNWVPKLRTALEKLKEEQDEAFREIYIFPGIELNVQGNVHLLGVFDPDIDEATLSAIPFLVEYDPTIDTTKKSLNDVIEIIIKNNGIAIPAHVDGPSGLLYEGMKPSIIRAALRTGKLLAVEVLGEDFEHPSLTEFKSKLSYVVGSDSHSTDTIGSKYTWVKMGIPNIEAMRLALFDTEDGAIRYKDIVGNPNDRHGKTYIESVEISNGKYIGRKTPYQIEFSPWLNSIIGGRGSGKSSVLKFIRLILGRGDELPESLQEEYNDFMKAPKNRTDLGMLQKKTDDKAGTVVKMDICVDGVSHLLRWEDDIVSEYNFETQTWEKAQALKERFPVRMFSQKQLYEMTGDTSLLFDYLDSRWNYNEWENDLAALKLDYGNASRELHTLEDKQKRLEELKVQLNDIKKKIGVFETEKTKSVLQKKESLKKQIGSVEDIYKTYSEFVSWGIEFSKYQHLTTPSIPDDIDAETAKVIKNWCKDIDDLIVCIKDLLLGKYEALVSMDTWVKSLPISKEIDANQSELNEVIEQLRNAGVDDVDRYAELISEKERVEAAIERMGDVSEAIAECKEYMNRLKGKWLELVYKRYNSRNTILSQWNQIGALRLSLIPFGEVSSNENTFRQIIRRDSGAVFNKEILEYDEDGGLTKKGILYFLSKEGSLEDKLKDFEKMKVAVSSASNSLGKRFSDYLRRFFDDYPDSVAELEMWVPKDALKLEINMNKKGKPLYRSIDAGSPGQRTSAVLSLILGISSVPIIIDQPEDDLDTRNITDIVVSSIGVNN